ncbi:thioredoxin reductase [Arthrobacter sp. SLBN-100]|uniref:NAD(P)/FAD-dependent oxidoreductase n=1 Tax=Arthrobacter sp. SLBN-100 TaxID=2768450 RepID=UPI00115287CC|nr:NAD(P)/FAD-dependent oxidoreductase [Arthrobacter sp. SLBN-100]TQJ67753.1 thioredoxin reductase [Arthrobacter sp. SLBN-100]
MKSHFEVAIIGGGPAGLAAAQVLGRQRRRVILVDSRQGRNAAASKVHMVLGREGTTPSGLVLAGRQELAGLPTVSILPVEAIKVLVADGKILVWATAREITADFLILATGVVDQLPPIPGIDAAFGKCLFHCPLCHGLEATDQRLVVLGNSEHAAFMAAYVQDRISRDVQLCSNGEPRFSRGTRTRLHRNGIRIIEDEVAGIRAHAGGLTLTLGTASSMTYRAGFLSSTHRQRSPFGQALGCSLTDDGRVRVDHFQRTSVPLVFAVGDMAKVGPATGNMTFVATAIASGVTAAAFLDEDIFARNWDSQDTSQ